MLDAMLPFVIDRHSRISLTKQVTDGLRRAIETGHFKAGARLPTMLEVASELSVSLDVVRTAIARLSREDLLTARRGRGIEVCPAGSRQRWQAHVLYLHWPGAISFFEAVSGETMVEELQLLRILVTPVHMNYAEINSGFPLLRFVADAGPVDMALVSGGAKEVGILLTEKEIPFIHMSAPVEPLSRLAVRHVVEERTGAMKQAAEHAARLGTRTMLILNPGGGGYGDMRRIAEAVGISVAVLEAPPDKSLGAPASVEQGGLKAMARWLESGASLPDLIFFPDDYVASGGLTALLDRGVSIPRDVQVISWANRNLGPIFPLPLTRIENDPVETGKRLAGIVVDALKKPHKKVRKAIAIGPRFIVGETTARR